MFVIHGSLADQHAKHNVSVVHFEDHIQKLAHVGLLMDVCN